MVMIRLTIYAPSPIEKSVLSLKSLIAYQVGDGVWLDSTQHNPHRKSEVIINSHMQGMRLLSLFVIVMCSPFAIMPGIALGLVNGARKQSAAEASVGPMKLVLSIFMIARIPLSNITSIIGKPYVITGYIDLLVGDVCTMKNSFR